MWGCSGPHFPPNRASCSHFSIPAPLTHLKANPPLSFFLLQDPVFFPQELSASPHFSFLLQTSHSGYPCPLPPLPLFLFTTSRPHKHPWMLLVLSFITQPCPRALPCGFYTLHCFFWLLPYLVPFHHPGLYQLLTKPLSNHFGQCLDFTGGHPVSPISRGRKPHSAFPSPL